MKKHIFYWAIVTCLMSFSQDKLEYVDLNEIAKKATESSKNNEYVKVLDALNNISKNDSTYCSTLTSKSYYLLQLKKYDEVIQITDYGLKNGCVGYDDYFYINKVVAYIGKEEFNKAIEVANEGLRFFPKSKKLWFNIGASYEGLKMIEKAVSAYKKTILLSPLYPQPHLKLGNICYKQEKMAQALMCFNMYLLLDPEGEQASEVINSLNSFVSASNINEADSSIQISSDDVSFEDIDLVLSQNVALNKKYVTGNKINIDLVKQNHALLELLKEFSGNNGFWDSKYVPFYNWVSEKNTLMNLHIPYCIL